MMQTAPTCPKPGGCWGVPTILSFAVLHATCLEGERKEGEFGRRLMNVHATATILVYGIDACDYSGGEAGGCWPLPSTFWEGGGRQEDAGRRAGGRWAGLEVADTLQMCCGCMGQGDGSPWWSWMVPCFATPLCPHHLPTATPPLPARHPHPTPYLGHCWIAPPPPFHTLTHTCCGTCHPPYLRLPWYTFGAFPMPVHPPSVYVLAADIITARRKRWRRDQHRRWRQKLSTVGRRNGGRQASQSEGGKQ